MKSHAALSMLGALIFSFLCCTASALDPHRAIPQYLRDSWSKDDSFPGGQVSAIAQTSDGALWIGGDKGLVRFDGLSFRLLQESSKGVPITHVLGLATDAEGGLWVWMQGANVLRYSNGSFENVTSRRALPDGDVTAMSQTQDGGILLSTVGQETFEYRSGQIHKAGTVVVPGTLILSNAKTDDGRIWVGTSDNGLFCIQAGQIVRMNVAFAPKKINVLLSSSRNTLWIGTEQGLFRWDGQKMSNAEVPSSLRSDSIFSITSDRDGGLWAGTPHGLFRFAISSGPAGKTVADHSDQVPTALFQDREGDLWIGTSQGLQRWRDGVFAAYPAAANTLNGSSGPIFADSDGRIWFGPADGGLYSLGISTMNRTYVPNLSHDVIYSIAGLGEDLWIGRQQGGLTHLYRKGPTFSNKTYTEADGLAQNSVYVVQETRDGTVWAGTLSAGLSRFKNGTFSTYTTTNGLASNTITAIEEDERSALWVATPNGVSVLSAGKWRTYSVKDGLPSDEATALMWDSSSDSKKMWIGTANGLALFSASGGRSFEHIPELLRQPILGLAKDSAGSLWVATPEHILRLDPAKLLSGTLESTDIREYDRTDGLPSSESIRRSRSMLEDGSGRIWISTQGGLAIADPANLIRPPIPALVQIKSLLADGHPISLQQPEVPASQHRVTLQFAGVSLSVPERVRYRYRLDGFDKEWSEATTTREAVYTNLEPGAYRFHVTASNSDGVWNITDVSFPFFVEAALWQTRWFRLAAVMMVGLAMWWGYLFRTRQLARQLQLRFEERLAERMRIAQDLHDTLLQGFLSASLQLDVAAEYVSPDSPASPLLSRVLALMRQVCEDCRNSLGTLRNGDKFGGDLEAGFSALPQELGLGGTVSYRVLVNGSPRALEPMCRDELFLVGREAVLNAFRHADASLIEVELVYERTGLHLFVRDDGRGIEELTLLSGKERHWGVTGMRERAAKVGAQFSIWSRPAKGTEIELMVPGSVAFLRDKRAGFSISRALLAFKHKLAQKRERVI